MFHIDVFLKSTSFSVFTLTQVNIEIVDIVYDALQEINSNIDFDTQDNVHASPLHYAGAYEDSDVAIHLLERYPQKINVLGQNGSHL